MLSCPLAEAGEHKWLWHSPAPSLKPVDTQTRHSATALLKLTGTAFLKSGANCLAIASKRVQSTEDIPLDCLALVAKRAGIQSNVRL